VVCAAAALASIMPAAASAAAANVVWCVDMAVFLRNRPGCSQGRATPELIG
jgi:hypothetical protein